MTERRTLGGIRAAVFDLDGTLFDSVDLWHRIDDEFLGKRGLVATEEYRHGISALATREGAVYTARYYRLPDTPEELMEEWAAMARAEYAHSIKLLPFAAEYLRECKSSGLKLIVVTSLAAELALPCLKNNGVFELFDEIVTADDCGLSKSSPEIFIHAAKRVGVEPQECVAFDDVLPALGSAKKAGMTTVAVEGKMLYGKKAAEFADFVINDWRFAPRLTIEK